MTVADEIGGRGRIDVERGDLVAALLEPGAVAAIAAGVAQEAPARAGRKKGWQTARAPVPPCTLQIDVVAGRSRAYLGLVEGRAARDQHWHPGRVTRIGPPTPGAVQAVEAVPAAVDATKGSVHAQFF